MLIGSICSYIMSRLRFIFIFVLLLYLKSLFFQFQVKHEHSISPGIITQKPKCASIEIPEFHEKTKQNKTTERITWRFVICQTPASFYNPKMRLKWHQIALGSIAKYKQVNKWKQIFIFVSFRDQSIWGKSVMYVVCYCTVTSWSRQV